jgi:hypothetical protein
MKMDRLSIQPCIPMMGTCAVCGHVEQARYRDEDLRGFVGFCCESEDIIAEINLRKAGLLPPKDDQLEAA